MHLLDGSTTNLSSWIRAELEPERTLSAGTRGMAVRRLQEWLNINGFGVAIDSDFGPVTAQAVSRFQRKARLPENGVVDEATHRALIRPMERALQRSARRRNRLGDMIVDYGTRHLKERPIETGGQNCGPWVRLYMKGNDGASWAWCAGFVVFLLEQARQTLGVPMPIAGSFSCDSLSSQAAAAGIFVAERNARPGAIPPGSIFLVRRTSSDWTHTGIVVSSGPEAFDTIEGNTNDDGSRDGFEVCARTRGYADKDFIVWR